MNLYKGSFPILCKFESKLEPGIEKNIHLGQETMPEMYLRIVFQMWFRTHGNSIKIESFFS